MQKIGDLVKKYKNDDTDKYVSREFQKFGYDLAQELGDLKHKSLYIKLSKTQSRGLLEAARNFVKDAPNVRNKPALFLWKFGELKKTATSKGKQ
jgi:hypothetical protein